MKGSSGDKSVPEPKGKALTGGVVAIVRRDVECVFPGFQLRGVGVEDDEPVGVGREMFRHTAGGDFSVANRLERGTKCSMGVGKLSEYAKFDRAARWQGEN